MIGKISVQEQRILFKAKTRLDENSKTIDAIVKSYLRRVPNGLIDRKTGVFIYR